MVDFPLFIFCLTRQQVLGYETRFVISAWLHTLPWWLVATPHRGQWLASQRFNMISGRLFYPLGGTGNVSGRNNNFLVGKKQNNGIFHYICYWVAKPHWAQRLASQRFDMISGRMFYPWGGTDNIYGRNNYPPRELKWSLWESFTLWEVQAMSLGGITVLSDN